ncbi:MAG: hypothetical protein WAV93_06085 [Bacteroidales bacterium]
MVKVKNLGGTGPKDCRCGSWKQHWIKNSIMEWPKYCTAIGCTEAAREGGHVKKVRSTDNNHYIIPICYSHNALGEDKEYDVSEIYFVSANRSATCDK